ncbi:MAG: OmpH family outer membrane protein [Paludibacteraceae bacterium]|nr:OmpH family outer membrane protein [Paludibacteraceae bacterium]
MKKIQLIVDVVLLAAVVALFVIVFTGKKKHCNASCEGGIAVDSEAMMPLAYVNLDSILVNYAFAQDANEKLMSKQEDARLKMNTKMRTFEQEYADFQRKLENNAFLSRERAESEAARLQKKQQDLQELEAKLTQEILEENQKLNLQLADTLNTFLKEFNADGRYQVILSNQGKDNVLMAAEGYDITEEVIDGLNARYKK